MPIADPLTASVITVSLIVLVSACSITDILSRKIPNVFLVTALSLILICHGTDSGAFGLFRSFAGLLAGMSMLLPFYFLGAAGAGDVKLLGVVGAALGPEGVLVAGLATLISGGLLGTAWIIWRIVDAFIAAHFLRHNQLQSVGPAPDDATFPQVKIRGTAFPYAPAIACGTFTAIWSLGLLSPTAG